MFILIMCSYVFVCSAAALAQLDQEVASIKCAALAPGTRANLISQRKSYLTFCHTFGLTPIPAQVSTLCRYIAFLARSLKSYQSLKNYLHGVSVLHSSFNVPFIGLSQYDIRLMLQATKKQLGNTPFAKLPIDPNMLMAFIPHLDFSSPQDTAFWAATLIAFFGFLRKGNLVPPSFAKFDARRHLSRGNIILVAHGLQLHLQQTKTLQAKDSAVTITLASLPHHLDPVSAYLHHVRLVPAPPSSPAFLYTTSAGSTTTLTHTTFVARLKSLLRLIGVNPTLYSGHSLRRGGCTLAFRAGVSTELLQFHGTWRSDCYNRYLAYSHSQLLSVTRDMGRLLPNGH